jgi:broad specificity phosphatase PhoE
MTVYYLRHEHRPMDDSTFNTELTDKGKEAARTSLKRLLLRLDIKRVFCSPFIRCQQTIHPFIDRTDLQVNVENCLQEVYWDPKFIDNPKSELNIQQKEFYKTNNTYKSLLPPNTLSYPEDKTSVRKRVKVFSDYLKNKNFTNNVLVCSHMGIVNVLLSHMSDTIDRAENEFYDMGKVSKIVDNKLVFLN